MLIEYYECSCDYKVLRDDIDTEKVVLSNHMVDELRETVCCKCGESCACVKRVQVKRFICPSCKKDLVLKEEFIGDDVEVCGGGVPQIMGMPYKIPIHSDALGIMPDQVEEHKKMFSNIELDDQNRPIFTNMKAHQKYMDKCGIIKQTQKTGQGKNKIYSYPGSKCS